MATNQEGLLTRLSSLSTKIYNNHDPHNPQIYLDRGRVYVQLGFHDLAAADAYRALMLLECVWDPDCAEYVARRRIPDSDRAAKAEDDEEEDEDDFVDITRSEYDGMIGPTYFLLVWSLTHCGCLRDAFEFQGRGIVHLAELIEENEEDGKPEEANDLFYDAIRNLQGGIARLREIEYLQSQSQSQEEIRLPGQGFARRVLYPWNEHEPDRKSPETLALLNKRLETVAPDLEVRAVALPALHEPSSQDNSSSDEGEEVSIQLGLFAKKDLLPGSIILRESSLLTATNRLHDDLCDACNGPLPDLSSGNGVACDECTDTIFCSQTCHDQAQSTYHAAICGQEGLESIGKDVADPKDKADYLYFLLLARAIAMAATQDVHPLELPEIKYIWGDFHPYHNNLDNNSDNGKDGGDGDGDGKLPFSFQLSILQPIRLLEEMGLDPFTSLARYDTWILNTLYAKFRGTASGRLSTWDGGPEVCAVHPLWCLANHSCDPNVRWEWGGEICFYVRGQDERAVWKRKGADEKERRSEEKAGIRANEEILNHYCDIGLDVVQRRDWARGALGGLCQCARCQWEAS